MLLGGRCTKQPLSGNVSLPGSGEKSNLARTMAITVSGSFRKMYPFVRNRGGSTRRWTESSESRSQLTIIGFRLVSTLEHGAYLLTANATVDHYQVSVRLAPGANPSAVFDHVRDRLFTYDIFPPQLIHSAVCPSGRITGGTTIVQRIALGPAAPEMAVRMIDVWDRDDEGVREAGFTYATVTGHPECGIATFRVRLDGDGRVLVLVDARSRPGLLLTRLGRPMARLFQRGITKAALRRLSRT